MSKFINNWKPEVRSLINALVKAGCVIDSGNNGEDGTFTLAKCGTMAKFIDNLTACDEAHLFVRTPGKDGLAFVYLVFGNSPGELPSDYTLRPEIEAACNEHSKKWDGVKQPKKLSPYYVAEAARITKIAHELNSNLDTGKLGIVFYCGSILPVIVGARFRAIEGVSCGQESTLLSYGVEGQRHAYQPDMAVNLITNSEGKQLFPRR